MITPSDLIALSPLLAITAAAVIVMLVIAFQRNHALIFYLTAAGIVLALLLLPVAAQVGPRTVTPLLRIDPFALAFMGLLMLSGLVIASLSRDHSPSQTDQPEEMYLLLLTALLGATVLTAATHFASFFLGLETLSVSLFALVAYPYRNLLALEAGIKYLVLSGTATGLLVFGMALFYAEAGVLAFAALPAAAPESLLVAAGLALIIAAVAFKLSLVPFHLWTPDVYQGAPAPVTALLATIAKGAVLALLMRFTLAGGLGKAPLFEALLSLLAIASMLAGNLLALRQTNLKRLLAYSSIAHMGYLLIVLVASARIGAEFAAEALLLYAMAYFVTTLAAFGVISVMSTNAVEAEYLDDYTGLFHSRPGLAGVLGIALLSLAGIPLTAGFIGKFYLFAAGGQGHLWVLLATLIVGSGIGLYYYLRVIAQLFRDNKTASGAPALTWRGGVLLAVLTVLMLGLGIYPRVFIELALPAAAALR